MTVGCMAVDGHVLQMLLCCLSYTDSDSDTLLSRRYPYVTYYFQDQNLFSSVHSRAISSCNTITLVKRTAEKEL